MVNVNDRPITVRVVCICAVLHTQFVVVVVVSFFLQNINVPKSQCDINKHMILRQHEIGLC